MYEWDEWQEWEGLHGGLTRKCMKKTRKIKAQGNLKVPKTEDFKDCDNGTQQGISTSSNISMSTLL